ncbi:MAG: ribosome maturation factor RimP [Micrococcales bacterium]|nr:ribosome maturation factor RimP [Micrococcales bacterium]
MATMTTSARVRQVVEPAVAAAGLLVDGVDVARAGSRTVVRVVVDAAADDQAALDLDRLGEATRAVSAALDAEDVVPGRYTLEVSSPGVGRPLTLRRHYVRALGRTVAAVLDDGTRVTGRLAAVDGDDEADATVVIVPSSSPGKGRRPVEGPPVAVRLAAVRTARVEVDLSGVGPGQDEDGSVEA